jgi:hypothetical protein
MPVKVQSPRRTQLRSFLAGEEIAFSKENAALFKRLLKFKESSARRKNPKLFEFTHEEERVLRSSFAWLIKKLEPTNTPAVNYAKVIEHVKRARKITAGDLSADINTAVQNHHPGKKELVYGQTSLFLDTIHPERSHPKGSKYFAFLGLNDSVKDLLFVRPMRTRLDFACTSIHELAHNRYGFGEAPAYAVETMFLLSENATTREKIEKDYMAQKDKRGGYLDGLRLILDAMKHGGTDWESYFWAKIRMKIDDSKYHKKGMTKITF